MQERATLERLKIAIINLMSLVLDGSQMHGGSTPSEKTNMKETSPKKKLKKNGLPENKSHKSSMKRTRYYSDIIMVKTC